MSYREGTFCEHSRSQYDVISFPSKEWFAGLHQGHQKQVCNRHVLLVDISNGHHGRQKLMAIINNNQKDWKPFSSLAFSKRARQGTFGTIPLQVQITIVG